jgi:hypothetical protein
MAISALRLAPLLGSLTDKTCEQEQGVRYIKKNTRAEGIVPDDIGLADLLIR